MNWAGYGSERRSRAKDDDPDRVEKLARIRLAFEQLRAGAALFFADELDINLLPKVGYQWMPKGEQVEVLTPGTNEKRYLAGALGSDHWHHHPLCVVSQADRALPRLARHAGSNLPRAALLLTSPSSSTTPRFTRPPKSSNGSRPIRASSCSTYPPTVPGPIRLSGPLAMSMTSVPAIIPANASGTWCRM